MATQEQYNPQKVIMKKIFLSFTSLLSLLGSGKVTAQDLSEGLFFFGCTRRHAYEPGAQGESDERTFHNGRYASAHPVLVSALRQAENEGRVAWRHDPFTGELDPWGQLDDLLRTNGLPQVQRGCGFGWDAGYPAIVDHLRLKGIALTPVY